MRKATTENQDQTSRMRGIWDNDRLVIFGNYLNPSRRFVARDILVKIELPITVFIPLKYSLEILLFPSQTKPDNPG